MTWAVGFSDIAYYWSASIVTIIGENLPSLVSCGLMKRTLKTFCSLAQTKSYFPSNS